MMMMMKEKIPKTTATILDQWADTSLGVIFPGTGRVEQGQARAPHSPDELQEVPAPGGTEALWSFRAPSPVSR